MQQALVDLSEERSRSKEKRYYTVVLMTDGENNRGLSQREFVDWYKNQGESVRGLPVFPILFGEDNPDELKEIADLTGGRLFDSRFQYAGRGVQGNPRVSIMGVSKETRALSVPQRTQLFLYSTRNIVGCLLALSGLGLFFGGVIHVWWGAIVAGLYAAGVLGWPDSDLAETAERTELSAGMLAQQVRKLVESVAGGLPKDAVGLLQSIQGTLSELLPRLQELRDRGVISAKDSFTVLETVRRYLPDTLAAYLRLPKLYAQVQTLADGRTATQTLVDQLRLLDMSLKDVAKSAFAGDAETLVSNGNFLENKFSEKLAFRP